MHRDAFRAFWLTFVDGYDAPYEMSWCSDDRLWNRIQEMTFRIVSWFGWILSELCLRFCRSLAKIEPNLAFFLEINFDLGSISCNVLALKLRPSKAFTEYVICSWGVISQAFCRIERLFSKSRFGHRNGVCRRFGKTEVSRIWDEQPFIYSTLNSFTDGKISQHRRKKGCTNVSRTLSEECPEATSLSLLRFSMIAPAKISPR